MPRPITLRERMKDAVPLGVPDRLPSSARPLEATPTPLRLACAEAWLRAGAGIGVVSYHAGLSRHVVRVIANSVLVGWRYVVAADLSRPKYQMDADELATVRLRLAQGKKYSEIATELGVGRDAVKFHARKLREKEASQ